MDIAYSINGVPIRLARERWFHIVENHDELAGRFDDVLSTIEDPDLIFPGYGGALIAVRGFEQIFQIVPHLTQLPVERLWGDYDPEADVLYLSFERPQRATDSEMLDNGVLLRYRGRKLVGVTVFEASKR